MRISPTEQGRLMLFTAAMLARETLRRGFRLNAPEATALICDEMHMAARGGGSYEEVLRAGQDAVTADQIMEGVADLLTEISLEVLLDEGTRLVVLRREF